MKKLKWIISVLFSLILIANLTTIQPEASETNNDDSINLSNTNYSKISELMSAQELINEYVKNEGTAYERASETLFPNDEREVRPHVDQYRIFSKDVGPHGSVYFYTRTSEAPPNFSGIVEVLGAGYNTGNEIYGGTLFYNLVNSNRIDFILNGHLYNSGTLSISQGESIDIGQSATLHFDVLYGNSYQSGVHVNSMFTY